MQAMCPYIGPYVLVTFILKQGFHACDVCKAVRVERPAAQEEMEGSFSKAVTQALNKRKKKAESFLKNG